MVVRVLIRWLLIYVILLDRVAPFLDIKASSFKLQKSKIVVALRRVDVENRRRFRWLL